MFLKATVSLAMDNRTEKNKEENTLYFCVENFADDDDQATVIITRTEGEVDVYDEFSSQSCVCGFTCTKSDLIELISALQSVHDAIGK